MKPRPLKSLEYVGLTVSTYRHRYRIQDLVIKKAEVALPAQALNSLQSSRKANGRYFQALEFSSEVMNGF